MAINALDFENLNVGLKTNYDKAIPELIRAESPVLDMLEEDSSFTKDRGGRQLLWDILIDRQMNIGVAGEDDFFPGFSSDTNDDIDRSVPIEATQGIGYAYASLAVTEHQLAESHKKFEMFKDYGLGRWVKETQSDLRMQLEWMLLGDGTGYLGTVTGAPSLSGGNTIVTLAAASSFNARGIASTQRLGDLSLSLPLSLFQWRGASSGTTDRVSRDVTDAPLHLLSRSDDRWWGDGFNFSPRLSVP